MTDQEAEHWDETNIDECLSAYTGGGADVDLDGACRDLLAQLKENES